MLELVADVPLGEDGTEVAVRYFKKSRQLSPNAFSNVI